MMKKKKYADDCLKPTTGCTTQKFYSWNKLVILFLIHVVLIQHRKVHSLRHNYM